MNKGFPSPWHKSDKEYLKKAPLVKAFRCEETKEMFFRYHIGGDSWVMFRPKLGQMFKGTNEVAHAQEVDFIKMKIPRDSYKDLLYSFEAWELRQQIEEETNE